YVYLVCSRAHRKAGCRYLAVSYKDVELAFRRNAKVIIRDAPRGRGAEEIDAEIANLETVVDHLTEEASGIADELIEEKSGVLRQRLREKEAALEKAKAELKALRVKRNTEVAPFVYRRLLGLWEALRRKPLSVPEVNKALKETMSKIVIDPEEGRLWVYWHHHEGEPTNGGAFYSRHSTVFDDGEGDAA
ncbi:MAG TPA: hypothetical protein VH164_00075, partial [Ktedonobacteraceae bacterium]|nr:hypothetical protein [Ktedonobacteraceae bacterium]